MTVQIITSSVKSSNISIPLLLFRIPIVAIEYSSMQTTIKIEYDEYF